ncbi:helix-turn-helix transcriptional regulator [Microbacterium gorillae]|uniref:helix-turn-helix transcriptional regulator n=1 Tax=Microbacterium gorillae TaxID=1231063 RepID=UPI00058CB12D|nr:helix-turn-helix transcriptional regulator [Microbacterium gorillae]
MASEIGDFLRAKRERLTPEDCGLPNFGQRRVPGLRREEVALLSGVSPDYYVRLEQGRARQASDQILDAVARTLRLDAVETEHLHRLVHPDRVQPSSPNRSTRAGILALLDAMTDVPAFVLGPCMDIIAANLLGDAVLAMPQDPHRRNAARQVFLDPDARAYYPDWENVAIETAAHLRRVVGLRPDDLRLRSLIGELTIDSKDFARLWARQEVVTKSHGTKIVHHPNAGRLEFSYETLTLPGEPDQMLVTYTPSNETTRDALTALGSWNADAPTGRPTTATPRTPAAPQG